MLPVLFSMGKFNVSSFGIFLALGFLLGVFLIWRLGRAWDLDEEKVLDLSLLTFLGGLIGARLYFVLEHLSFFADSPLSVILINKFPGFSFWGGFLGGWLSLYFFSKRFKMNFWQLADIALVGFLGGLILSNIGCLLGGCNAGVLSKAFFAVNIEGLVGKRWPVPAVEAILLSLALMRIWSLATHFHQRGKIVSLGFIYIGIIELILVPVRQNQSKVIFPLVLTVLGLIIYYRVTRKNPLTHLKMMGKFLGAVITSSEIRKQLIQSLGKSWYNQKTNISWKFRNFKKILRRSNVKLS